MFVRKCICGINYAIKRIEIKPIFHFPKLIKKRFNLFQVHASLTPLNRCQPSPSGKRVFGDQPRAGEWV